MPTRVPARSATFLRLPCCKGSPERDPVQALEVNERHGRNTAMTNSRPHPARFLTVLLALSAGLAAGSASAQISVWATNPANGHLYGRTTEFYWGVDKTHVINTPTVLDAEALAVSLGGHLVTINDA